VLVLGKMPVDDFERKIEVERDRMHRLVQRLREAASRSSNLYLAADLHEAWTELERLLGLGRPHLTDIDLAIVRARVVLERAHRVAGEGS